MRKIIFNLFFWLFGFTRKKVDNGKKGIIMILIDGLSFDTLSNAVKKGYCPQLKKMSGGSYALKSYYCGLPAATTATEAMLFYGNNYNIPGFTWYDRNLKKFVRGNRSLELTAFEDSLQKNRHLFSQGSVIMSVYSGGATELNVSGRNLTFSRSLYLLKTAHYFLIALLYPIQLARTMYLTLKTLLLYRRSSPHSVRDTFTKIILGQFSCFLTEIEIMRNTEKIFVDFLLYDEFAHEYGPTHTNTLSTLRLVDRYIKRIIHSAHVAERSYDLIILSDHGQTESIPFDFPKMRSIPDIKKALNNPTFEVIKTYGGIIPSNERKELYVVPAGSTLQLYFSHHLDRGLTEIEINTQFPNFIANLLLQEEFGWVLVKVNKDSSVLYGKNGSLTFTKSDSPQIKGNPFPHMDKDTIPELILSLTRYCTFPNNGDLVLFGDVTNQKKVYSFEKHRGTHGGFYGPMAYPFIMSNNPRFTGNSMESLFDTIAVSV